jgi:hypothetical protein
VELAEVAYQRNDLDAALRHVTEGIALCRRLLHARLAFALAPGLVTLAWIRQAQRDAAGALETIGEAERVAPNLGMANLFNPVPAQRARLLLAQGDLAAADRWTQQRALGADACRTCGSSGKVSAARRWIYWMAVSSCSPVLLARPGTRLQLGSPVPLGSTWSPTASARMETCSIRRMAGRRRWGCRPRVRYWSVPMALWAGAPTPCRPVLREGSNR